MEFSNEEVEWVVLLGVGFRVVGVSIERRFCYAHWYMGRTSLDHA